MNESDLTKAQQELARRVAADKRRVPAIIGVIFAAMMIGAFVVYQFPGDYRNPAILGAIIVIAILLFAVVRLFPGILCPRCEKQFDDHFGTYCPECGTHGLNVADRHFKAECRNCKKPLAFTGRGATGNARTRAFKIRFCTICGMSFGQRPL